MCEGAMCILYVRPNCTQRMMWMLGWGSSTLQLMDFKNPRTVVASGKINGVWGVDKCHFKAIPQFFYKVDVTHALIDDVPLLHPHEGGDQYLIRDVIGGSVLWSQKHMKT